MPYSVPNPALRWRQMATLPARSRTTAIPVSIEIVAKSAPGKERVQMQSKTIMGYRIEKPG